MGILADLRDPKLRRLCLRAIRRGFLTGLRTALCLRVDRQAQAIERQRDYVELKLE